MRTDKKRDIRKPIFNNLNLYNDIADTMQLLHEAYEDSYFCFGQNYNGLCELYPYVNCSGKIGFNINLFTNTTPEAAVAFYGIKEDELIYDQLRFADDNCDGGHPCYHISLSELQWKTREEQKDIIIKWLNETRKELFCGIYAIGLELMGIHRMDIEEWLKKRI